MVTTVTYGYGTSQQVEEAYQYLPSTAQEARELMEQVGTDGKVKMPNGKYVELPIFYQAAWLKFGMAFAATTLSFYAGYPNIKFNTILQTFLKTETMMTIVGNIVSQNSITLEQVDPDAYAKKLITPWTADPKIFAEAKFQEYLDQQKMEGYDGLLNQLTYAGISNTGDLRNPFKGKGPTLNIALLLFLAQTGQIGLMLMLIYRGQMKMNSAMSFQLAGVLAKQNQMKRKIMQKIASLSSASDDPQVATELQKVQLSMRQLQSAEELVTGIIAQLKDSLKSFWEMVMRVQSTENQMAMAAARG